MWKKTVLALAVACTPLLSNSVFAQTTEQYQRLFQNFSASGLSYADKRFLQTALAFEGHYNGLLDGDWGGLSQRALESYASKEFGTSAEEWHMAALAFSFFDVYERGGWAIRYLDGLNISFLFPYDAVVIDEPTDLLLNWRHTQSSLAYSVGIHSKNTAQGFHDFAENSHVSFEEPYTLRRTNVAITTAKQRDGGVLYVRSNFTNGSWSTIMLSASRRDEPILNAVAASIDVGTAPPITLTENGRLERAIRQTAALIADSDSGEQVASSSSGTPDQAPNKTVSGSGTGFLVAPDGLALTNAHVVDGCTELKFDGLPAEVVASSEDFDLALLKAEGWVGEEFATFSPSPAKLNSDVTVVGYPLAGLLTGLNVTRGSVSSQMGLGGDVAGMQITAPVQPGNSGGPVFAQDGEVVGVVVSKLNAQWVADATGDIPQNVNFAIRSEIAKLFLFQHGVEPQLGQQDDPLPPTELAELAAEITVFIECD